MGALPLLLAFVDLFAHPLAEVVSVPPHRLLFQGPVLPIALDPLGTSSKILLPSLGRRWAARADEGIVLVRGSGQSCGSG